MAQKDKQSRLLEAKDLAESAIEKLDLNFVDSFTASLYVEWANICLRLLEIDPTFSKKGTYRDVYNKMCIVIDKYPKNGYAYVAQLWAGIKYAESINDINEKMELLKSLSGIRDIWVNEVSDEDLEKNVIGTLDNLMDKVELTDERFKLSIQKGESYGLYFRVREILGKGEKRLDFKKPLDEETSCSGKCKAIIELLENEDFSHITANDSGCMYMLINAKWLLYSQQPIIPDSEDQCIGLSETTWNELYSDCSRYLDKLCTHRPPHITYLQALCAAHIPDRRNECFELFKELGRDDAYGRRTYHIICDSDRKPLRFNGRLSGKYNIHRDRGYISLDGFREPIYFRAERIGRNPDSFRENMRFYEISVATSFTGFKICK